MMKAALTSGSLVEVYDQQVARNEIIYDATQRQLLDPFQALLNKLISRSSWWRQWLHSSKPVQGLYVWGGVGIGKTFIMDLFYDALPFANKMRAHFHDFMQTVQLALIRYQGEPNPLKLVARDIADKAKVLCFDEFFVSDIADAMILERLLSALFEHGVVLVATSNISPDKLYLHGLHRQRFLPAIDLIQQQCQVIKVDSTQDYRFRALASAGVFFTPLTLPNQQQMEHVFARYAGGEWQQGSSIEIEGRSIRTKRLADEAVWFEFDDICQVPRSQVDYLAIAKRFPVVFVSDVPIMKPNDVATITYFIHLVDVFYDKRVKLVLSAEADIGSLYPAGIKHFEYQRTISRLHEMQTAAYIEQ